MEDFFDRIGRAETDKERDVILMSVILQGLEESIKKMVFVASVLTRFDQKLLSEVFDEEVSDTRFKKLIGLSFVERFEEKYFNVHERSRKIILEILWNQNKENLIEVSKNVFDVVKSKDLSDLNWLVEYFLHKSIINPESTGVQLNSKCHELWERNETNQIDLLTSILSQNLLVYSGMHKVMYYVHYWKGRNELLHSHYLKARKCFEECLSIGEFSGKNDLQGYCEKHIGDISRQESKFDEASENLKKALDTFITLGDKRGQAQSKVSLGILNQLVGKPSIAFEYIIGAEKLFDEINDFQGMADTLRSKGYLNKSLSRLNEAIKSWKDAQKIYSQLGDKLGSASLFRGLGEISSTKAEFKNAISYFDLAIEGFESIENLTGTSNALFSKALLLRDFQMLEQSNDIFNITNKQYNKLNDRLGVANSELMLGEIKRVQQEFVSSDRHLRVAIDIYKEIGHKFGVANTIYAKSELLRVQNKLDESEKELRYSVDTFKDSKSEYGLILCELSYGDLNRGRGNWEKALWNYSVAMKFFEEHQMSNQKAYTFWQMGLAYLGSNELQHAILNIKDAMKLYELIKSPILKVLKSVLKEIEEGKVVDFTKQTNI